MADGVKEMVKGEAIDCYESNETDSKSVKPVNDDSHLDKEDSSDHMERQKETESEVDIESLKIFMIGDKRISVDVQSKGSVRKCCSII